MKSRTFQATHIKPLKGAFITFEGTEGSGKSTQCQRLARSLQNQGFQVLQTREPGGTPLAEAVRNLLLKTSTHSHPLEIMTPTCETMLIFAARAQHIRQVIRPALEKGTVVLCDRFFDSTLAYQGYARGLDQAFLVKAQRFIASEIKPHLTFFLDLPVQEGLARRAQTKKQDRLDRESLAFHQRVRRGFLTLAQQHPKRIHTIDARKSPLMISKHIATITEHMIHNSRSLHLNGFSEKLTP